MTQFDILRLLTGLVLAAIIGELAYRRGSLDRGGQLGAILIGTTVLGMGGWAWGVAVVVFFVSSSALSRSGRAAKQRRTGQIYAKGDRRDLLQTLANGGVAALAALLTALPAAPAWLAAAFVTALATATADTWATELGPLHPHPPRLITTLRQVPPGTSGGISATGLLGGAAGALLIGAVFAVGTLLEDGTGAWWALWLAPLAGTLGSLADSLLGATVQASYAGETGPTERRYGADGREHPLVRGAHWMTNDLVNALATLVGALVGALVVGG